MNAVAGALMVMMALSLYRLAAGPTIYDRLLSLHLVSAQILVLMCLHGIRHQKSFYLDIAILYALLSFVETLLFVRFQQRRRPERTA